MERYYVNKKSQPTGEHEVGYFRPTPQKGKISVI